MDEIRLHTSQLPEMAARLRAGQRVLLSGRSEEHTSELQSPD